MIDNHRDISEPEVDVRLDLAVLRTALAWDRTLLAWVRTTLALLGAGIVLAKGAQLLHHANLLADVAAVRSGHLLGLTLSGVSTLLLGIVCVQYLRSAREFRAMSRARRFPAALLTSLLVILLGCAVFAVLVLDRG